MSERPLGEIGTISSSYEEFDWKLEKFSALQSVATGSYYRSAPFRFAGSEWFLELYPNGTQAQTNQNFVLNLYVTMYSEKQIHFTLGVRTKKGKLEVWRQDCIRPVPKYFGRVSLLDDFIKRTDIVARNAELLTSDCLTLTIIMSTTAPKTYRDASMQTDAELKNAKFLIDGKESPEKQGGEKALEDIGKLFSSGDKSDVVVQVGRVQFPVHSDILHVRSPVLSAMFRHDTAEKLSNKTNIGDCEPDVFREYLHYLYTGSVQSLTERNAFDLYRVADKYLADDLKTLCLQHVKDTLSVRTFCEAVKLSLAHEEATLLQLVVDFAAKNIRTIIGTVEWQTFLQRYPTEANELLIKSMGPAEEEEEKAKKLTLQTQAMQISDDWMF